MHRALVPCTLILALAACTEEKSPVPPPKPRLVKEPTRATTGVRNIQRDYADMSTEITRLEERIAKGEKPERWLVANQLQLVDNLIIAAERAEKEEARLDARHTMTRMRKELGQLEAERQKHFAEIVQIQIYLDEEAKGVGGIPPGFTAEELRDRLGDRREQAREIEKKKQALAEELGKVEDALKLETVPSTKRNIYTEEIEALRPLRSRIQAILDRLPK